MRLLLITFELDSRSAVLAWQARVAAELSQSCEQVIVVAQKVGDYAPQANMHVLTFPLAPQRAPARWLGGRLFANYFVWQVWKRHRFDAVFVHMNVEWTYRLYPIFRVLSVPVLMWYAHGTVSRRLRLAHRCATGVVTSTREGFRLPSDKVTVIGQGIDTSAFPIQPIESPCADIVTVSRISERKRIELIIDALAAIRRSRPDEPIRLRVVGSTLNAADRAYDRALRARVRHLNLENDVDFIGHVPMSAIARYYASAFVHVNVSTTGSMDKTVLEALACGCPVLTSNVAFADFFRSHPDCLLDDDAPEAVAARILRVYDRRSLVDRESLRRLVHGRHDVATYCQKVVGELRRLTGRCEDTEAVVA